MNMDAIRDAGITSMTASVRERERDEAIRDGSGDSSRNGTS